MFKALDEKPDNHSLAMEAERFHPRTTLEPLETAETVELKEFDIVETDDNLQVALDGIRTRIQENIEGEIDEDKFKNIQKSIESLVETMEEGVRDQVTRQETDNDALILMGSITLFIILISTLGLYGLASYMTVKQSKEIAVRKIFGAYVSDVIFTISKEYLKSILISILVAVPVTWIFVKMMFDSMPYNVGMSLDFFLYSITGQQESSKECSASILISSMKSPIISSL